VHHTRKAEADDPMDLISGTLGLTGSVDGALVLKRDRADADAVLHITGRDIEDETDLALRWDQSTATWSVKGNADDYRRSQVRTRVIDLLRRVEGPLTPREVSEMLGMPYENIRKVMHKMHGDTELVRDGGDNRLGFKYTVASHPIPTIPTNPSEHPEANEIAQGVDDVPF
jgi:hypothetical protein